MKKFILACLLVLSLVVYANHYAQEVEFKYLSLPALYLNEPYEVAMFILRDGRVFTYTTYEMNRINFYSLSHLAEVGNFSWSDVLVVLHSHFGIGILSQADIKVWNYLKGLGFTGYFGLYVQAPSLVIIWDKDNNKYVFPVKKK